MYSAVSVLVIGMLVLAGWQWNISPLKQPILHFTAMNPVTAVNFILTALSFLLLPPSGTFLLPTIFPQSKKSIAGQLLAGMVLLVGGLKIAEKIHLIHFSIDQAIFAGKLVSDAPEHLSNQMTAITAFCFILSGASLLSLNAETKTRKMPAHYLALAIGMFGLLSMVGYLYRVKTFYSLFQYTPMAIHTATCFLLISFSILFANPRKGIMREFTTSFTGSLMARRLLPFVILLPIFLGYARLWAGWQGLFSMEFGVTALVLSIVLVFVMLIWYNAQLLNKRDALGKEAELTLMENEERYRLLVSSVKDYAILMLDPGGNIVSWNKGAERIKGYKEKEIIGKHMSIFYTMEDLIHGEPAYNLAKARQAGRLEKEGWRVRQDGSSFWANIVITALYGRSGALQGFVKVTRDDTERKRAEEQIAYMARLMEDTSDAIFSTDSSFVIRSWNQAAELLFGYTLAEVKGKSTLDMLRAQLPERTRRAIREELRQGGYWKGEVVYLKKDDSLLDIVISISVIRNLSGQSDGFVMVCRDFTDRKKSEQQLKQFNEDLEVQVRKKTAESIAIFERITDAFIALDKDLCYTYLNKKAGEMIRRDPESLIGRRVWDVFPDAIGSSTYHAFNKAMAEQKNSTNTDYYPPLDLWQENHLYPSHDGLSVFIRDITEQKRREKEIRDYKYALDQSSIISITDQNGMITHVNDNFCKNSKFTEQELIGHDHGILNSGYHSKEFMDDLWFTISVGRIWKGEIRNKAKDGTLYWVDTTIVPFINENGTPYEYLSIRADITERKNKEYELQKSYQEIRQLASHLQDIREEERAGIAREIHDELGQQLTALKMDMSWVSKKTPLREDDLVRQKINGMLELLDTTVKTIRRIATDLRPGVLDDLGLIAAIEWQSQEFQKRSGSFSEFFTTIEEFNFSSTIAIGLFRICQESLTNIARHAEAKHVYITLERRENKSVQLKIEDDGKGFILDEIGSKKTLGLLGMRERTLMMGGDFEIMSTLGKGTTLFVTVPATIDTIKN